MNSEKILEQIQQTISGATQPVQQRFLSCTECLSCNVWSTATPLPAVCPHCKKPARFGMGLTFTEAKAKAIELAKTPATPEPAAPQAPATTVQAPATTVQAPATTVQVPAKQDEKTPVSEVAKELEHAAVAEEKAIKEEEKVAKKTVRRKPVAANQSNTVAVQPPAESVVEVAEVADVNPMPMSGEEAVNVTEPVDFKLIRDKATKKLIATHGINAITPVAVGRAKIYAKGYCIWQTNEFGGQYPEYCMREPGDDSVGFQRQLKEDRAKHGGTLAVDTAQLTEIAPPELVAVVFRGQLFANCYPATGPVLCKAGDTVEVGAVTTRTGGLAFRVLKVL